MSWRTVRRTVWSFAKSFRLAHLRSLRLIKKTNHNLPWGSHLHIDLVSIGENEETGEEEKILLDRSIYRFRRRDFDDSGRFERFFKYVDLSDSEIEKIIVEPFSEKHTDSCGEEAEAREK